VSTCNLNVVCNLEYSCKSWNSTDKTCIKREITELHSPQNSLPHIIPAHVRNLSIKDSNDSKLHRPTKGACAMLTMKRPPPCGGKNPGMSYYFQLLSSAIKHQAQESRNFKFNTLCLTGPSNLIALSAPPPRPARASLPCDHIRASPSGPGRWDRRGSPRDRRRATGLVSGLVQERTPRLQVDPGVGSSSLASRPSMATAKA
jgi:hypothetical protein